MRRQLVPGLVVTVIKAKTRPGIEASTNYEYHSKRETGCSPIFFLLHRVLTMNIINISRASNHKAQLAAERGGAGKPTKNALRKGYTI